MTTELLLPRFRPLRIAALAALCAFTFANSTAEAAQVWKLDFGAGNNLTTGPETWNNIDSAIGAMTDPNGGQVFDLDTTTGEDTPVDFIMLSRFNNSNTNGTTSFAGYPASATADSLFGNTETWPVSGGISNIFPRFKMASLDPGLAYDLTFYASRMDVGDNRETLYTVTGLFQDSVALNVANNISNEVTLFGVVPNEFGEIEVALSPGANNNNGNHFTYLGVLTMTVPEPASAFFLVGGAGLLLARRQRKVA